MSGKNRVLRFLMSLILVFSTLTTGIMPVSAADNAFKDVQNPNAFYYDAVLWAVNHDPQITNGTSATTFGPMETCTRGQVVTFLWRSAGQPEPASSKNPFTDVKKDKFYYDAVLWAVENGITTGTSTTTFSPADGCTRGQVVTFLHRAAGELSADNVSNPFHDISDSGYYYNAVLWAVANKVTAGTGATTFSPGETCTRGQIVTFLHRAKDFLNKFDLSDEEIEKEIETATDLNRDLADIESEFIITDNAQETAEQAEAIMQQMLDYCDKQKEAGEILDYEQDGCLIIIRLNAGNYVYEFKPFPGLQGGSFGSTAALSSHDRETGSEALSEKAQLLSDSFGLSRIATLEPYKEQFRTDIYDNAARAIENAGLGYEFTLNADAGEVTAELVKTLSNYKVIIWNGHGSYTEADGMHSILGLGEICTKENFEKYKEDFNNKRMVWFGSAATPEDAYGSLHYGVTTRFFSYYFDDGSFNGSFIFLGACCSAEDPYLEQTFIDKGAEAVLGYNETVHPDYNQAMFKTIFEELIKKDKTGKSCTVKQALETAKEKNGERDPNWVSAEQIFLEVFSTIPWTKMRNTHAELILKEKDTDSYRLSDYGSTGGDKDGRENISDSWDQIIASVNNGTYKSRYKIGDTKALDLGSEGVIEMQIAAFDADELADGSGTAAITWISKQVINSKHRMNPGRQNNSDNDSYILGTGSVGGWEYSEMRNWLKNDVKPLISSEVRSAIKPVMKYSVIWDTSLNYVLNEESVEDIWIPSRYEMTGTTESAGGDHETLGPTYINLYSKDETRIKKNSHGDNTCYWLRSADHDEWSVSNGIFFSLIQDNGRKTITTAFSEYYIAFGFCL